MSHPDAPPRASERSATDALLTILQILEPLDPETQRRILRSAAIFYGIPQDF